MTNSRIPWGPDTLGPTSEEAANETWQYWQNRINRASLVMLSEQKILSKEQTEKIAEAQREAERELNAPGTAPIFDIMPLEKLLIKHCGQEATLIHTGRSRQDIFATLNQARLRRAVLDTFDRLNKLRRQLLAVAEHNVETWMPAYTNGVQAMPITSSTCLRGFFRHSCGHSAHLYKNSPIVFNS